MEKLKRKNNKIETKKEKAIPNGPAHGKVASELLLFITYTSSYSRSMRPPFEAPPKGLLHGPRETWPSNRYVFSFLSFVYI
jgi:hypothetical protein